MNLFGLHVTTRRRHGAELLRVWRAAVRAGRALTAEQAAIVCRDVPAPREINVDGTVVGYPSGSSQNYWAGYADGGREVSAAYRSQVAR